MAPTEQDWIWLKRRFDKKSPAALRTMEFVGTDGYQIGVELMNVRKWLLAEPLNRIGMKQGAALPTKGTQFSDRLKRTNFVIRGHYRDENRIRAKSPFQIGDINPAG